MEEEYSRFFLINTPVGRFIPNNFLFIQVGYRVEQILRFGEVSEEYLAA